LQYLEVFAIVLAMLAYGLLGGYILRRWRRRRNRPLVSIHLDSMAWLSYWFPFVVFAEVWCLLGAAAIYLFIIFIIPDFYVMLGGALGLGLGFLMFSGFEVYMVRRARQLARRQEVIQ